MKIINGVIVLSRRNLLTLLHKLDQPTSARTIVGEGGKIWVRSENDLEHYGDRVPGLMDADTEAFIAAYGKKRKRKVLS